MKLIVITQPRSKHVKRSDRPGVAPIEFLFFLPVLIVFILAAFWITRVQNAMIVASLDAEVMVAEEVAALADQHAGFDLSSLHDPADDQFRMLVEGFEPNAKLLGGTIEATAIRATGQGVPGVIQGIGDARDEHVVLANSWQELFHFPENRREQRPLTLPIVIRGISPSMRSLAAFRGLLDFRGHRRGGSAVQGQTNNAVAEAIERTNRELVRVNRDIQSLRDRIRQLSQDADSNRELIDQLTEQLHTRERERTTLLASLSKLQAAQNGS